MIGRRELRDGESVISGKRNVDDNPKGITFVDSVIDPEDPIEVDVDVLSREDISALTTVWEDVSHSGVIEKRNNLIDNLLTNPPNFPISDGDELPEAFSYNDDEVSISARRKLYIDGKLSPFLHFLVSRILKDMPDDICRFANRLTRPAEARDFKVVQQKDESEAKSVPVPIVLFSVTKGTKDEEEDDDDDHVENLISCLLWHGSNSEILGVYLRLLNRARGCVLPDMPIDYGKVSILKTDMLVVVGVQCDYLTLVQGGVAAESVPEAQMSSIACSHLIEAFATQGGHVCAVREYLPIDHEKFANDVSEYCIQGHGGSRFTKEVTAALTAQHVRCRDLIHIAFRSFHRNSQNSGIFDVYDGGSPEENGNRDETNKQFTVGAFVLNSSMIHEDINAPPDVCAFETAKSVNDLAQELGIKRVFIAGNAFDGQVIDSAVSASRKKFDAHILLDACRPIYDPLRQNDENNGFLTKPEKIGEILAGHNIKILPMLVMEHMVSIVPNVGLSNPLHCKNAIKSGFPDHFGPLTAQLCKYIQVEADLQSRNYFVKGLDYKCRQMNISPVGRISTPAPIPFSSAACSFANFPQSSEAKFMMFAYPLPGVAALSPAQVNYIAGKSMKPSLHLKLYGGFLFTDDTGCVVRALALTPGAPGVSFKGPYEWTSEMTKAVNDSSSVSSSSPRSIHNLSSPRVEEGEIRSRKSRVSDEALDSKLLGGVDVIDSAGENTGIEKSKDRMNEFATVTITWLQNAGIDRFVFLPDTFAFEGKPLSKRGLFAFLIKGESSGYYYMLKDPSKQAGFHSLQDQLRRNECKVQALMRSRNSVVDDNVLMSVPPAALKKTDYFEKVREKVKKDPARKSFSVRRASRV